MIRAWITEMRSLARCADAALGGLFVYAGFAKAANPRVAIDGVDALLPGLKIGVGVVVVAVAVEVAIGGLLILSGGRAVRVAGFALLVGFTAYLVALKVWAPDTPCGCAGARGVPGMTEFVRNGLLAAGAALLLLSAPASAHDEERTA